MNVVAGAPAVAIPLPPEFFAEVQVLTGDCWISNHADLTDISGEGLLLVEGDIYCSPRPIGHAGGLFVYSVAGATLSVKGA